MADLKPGDVVEYVYPQFLDGHGSIAVVEKIKPDQHYSIRVRWIDRPMNHWPDSEVDSHPSCWRKLGELEVPDEPVR